MSNERAECAALIGCITRRLPRMNSRQLAIVFAFIKSLIGEEVRA